MRPRKHRFLFVCVALAASLAISSTTASALRAPKTLNLLAVTQTEQPLGFSFERPPIGGDRFAFTDTLYTWAGTKRGGRVGHIQALATFITGFGHDFSHPATVFYQVQGFIPGGSLLVQGFAKANPNGPSKGTLPIIGGTGIYDNARGYVKFRDLGNGETGKTSLEIRVLP